MPKSFFRFLNQYYNTKHYSAPISPIKNKSSFDELQNVVNDYLKNNKIKLGAIYNYYISLETNVMEYVFLFLILNDYKITKKLFIVDMINTINLLIMKYFKNKQNLSDIEYNENEKDGMEKLVKYIIHLIKSNDKIRPYFETDILITDKDYIIGKYYILYEGINIIGNHYQVLNNLERYKYPFIFKPKITFNLIKHKERFDKAYAIEKRSIEKANFKEDYPEEYRKKEEEEEKKYLELEALNNVSDSDDSYDSDDSDDLEIIYE